MNIKKEKQERKTKLRHKIPQTCKKDVEKKQKITKGDDRRIRHKITKQWKETLRVSHSFVSYVGPSLACAQISSTMRWKRETRRRTKCPMDRETQYYERRLASIIVWFVIVFTIQRCSQKREKITRMIRNWRWMRLPEESRETQRNNEKRRS